MMHAVDRQSERRGDAGFSLTETLIALFIISVLSAAGAAVLTRSMSLKQNFESEAASVATLERLQAVFRDDLITMARVEARPSDIRIPSHVFAGGDATDEGPVLALVRESIVPDVEDGVRGQENYVVYRREGDALIRDVWFSSTPREDEPDLTRVLLNDVENLEIAYGIRGEWTPEWVARTRDAMLPEMVRLRISLREGVDYEFLFLVGAST